MKQSDAIVISFAILYLFIIQMAGSLVESIYILDLLNTTLDEKALGLLFFFSPVLLILFRKNGPGWLVWLVFGLLFFARGVVPYLDTPGQMIASGIAVSAGLMLLPIMLNLISNGTSHSGSGRWAATGLALGIGLSALLRTVNFTIDYSLTPLGSWVGWGLGCLLGIMLYRQSPEPSLTVEAKTKGVTSATFGITLILTLVYFTFSAPSVLARWTQGNYPFIVITVSLLATGWVLLSKLKSAWSERISTLTLFIWNLLFTFSLVGTILAHRVPFPLTPDSPPVIIGSPSWIQQIPLALTLLLFPVIFVDMQVFISTIQDAHPSLGTLVLGLLLGSLAFVLLVFMNIFTNVWGYVEPISPFFRNKFWLPSATITVLLTLLSLANSRKTIDSQTKIQSTQPVGWIILLGGIFLVTGAVALITDRVTITESKSSLVLMTYNIQQANDSSGSKSYQQQLALIQEVSPDILALQESDSARISLNNNDYVRYYASKLGYYSYYGPKTVSGTYGTAILSRFPLQNPHTVFSYSDQDEIGTAVAEIEIDGRRFTIFNVHPDGSDTAMLAFARTLLAQAEGKANVIALGDFNLRADEVAYQLVDEVYTNAWLRAYPSGISDDGLDMSAGKPIDHIFFSPHLNVRNPVYLLAPESATDHPAHWAEVYWGE